MFEFLKSYIAKKIFNTKGTYVGNIFDIKNNVLEAIYESKNPKELRNALKKANLNNINIASNFIILIDFYNFCNSRNIENSFEHENLVLEFLFVYSSGKSDFTKKKYKNTLLSFFNKYRKEKNISSQNISLKNYTVYSKKKIFQTEVLNEAEINTFFHNVYLYARSYNDILIAHILLKTGIRVSELINIKLEDMVIIEKEYLMFYIKGKNNLYRTVYVKLEDIETEVKEAKASSKFWLLEDRQNKQIDRFYVYRFIRKIFKKSNFLKAKYGPHLLRHTFATHLYKKYKDIVLTQEALGHINVTSTKIYIHLDKKDIEQITNIFEQPL